MSVCVLGGVYVYIISHVTAAATAALLHRTCVCVLLIELFRRGNLAPLRSVSVFGRR